MQKLSVFKEIRDIQTSADNERSAASEDGLKDVIRSKGPKGCDTYYNPANYTEQILLAKGSGCRRINVKKVIPKNFRCDQNGQVTSVWLKEKGGLERYAPILKAYRGQLTVIVDRAQTLEPHFTNYPERIDNHAFRAEYVRARYDELAKGKKDLRADYRGYDKSIIAQISKDLGHQRLHVVVESYLR